MTIYKLYIMTHNKSGLKYLGYTTQNLDTYNGSGVYWNNHIKIHGKDISKEIIYQCESMEELKKMGKYYSELWNIVKEVDSTGKKIWANEKIEDGRGGGNLFITNNPMKNPAIVSKRSGDNHHMKSQARRNRQSERMKGINTPWHSDDHTLYHFIHENGTEEYCTRHNLKVKYNLKDSGLSCLIRGKYKSHKGWKLKN